MFGWGKVNVFGVSTQAKNLNVADMKIVEKSICKQEWYNFNNMEITNNMNCASKASGRSLYVSELYEN